MSLPFSGIPSMETRRSVRNTVIVAGILFFGVAVLCMNVLFAAGRFVPARATHGGAEYPPASPEPVVVDGEISRMKLSPGGRGVHGFYLDNGAEVNLPPHAHGSYVGEIGQRVEVTGYVHTNLVGESLVHATSITNADGETLDINNIAPPSKGMHERRKDVR